MNVACPSCHTVYRIDPERVPATGAATYCRECEAVFRVEAGAPRAPGIVTTAEPVPAAATSATPAEAPAASPQDATPPATAPEPPAQPSMPSIFGPQDPETRARRLARALVSDIKVYNPERWEQCRAEGTLREEFRDEIFKSWDEYVEQVGESMAKRTPFFREALNDILAAGEPVF